MKRVIGWSWYDGDEFTPGKDGVVTEEIWNAVLRDVKEHGYLFTGEDQQERMYCCPVMNDYHIARFSRRGFARLMAIAHGETGEYDYARYMESFLMPEEIKVIPDGKANADERVKDREWVIEVSTETFNTILEYMYDQTAVEEGKTYFLPYDFPIKYIGIPLPYDENAPCYWPLDSVCFAEKGTDRRAFYSHVKFIWSFDDEEAYDEWMEQWAEQLDECLFVENDLEKVKKQGKFILLFIE